MANPVVGESTTLHVPRFLRMRRGMLRRRCVERQPNKSAMKEAVKRKV